MPIVTSSPASFAISRCFLEHEVVRLLHDLTEHDLRAGAKGTIVHVYEGGAGYEVEFTKVGQRPKVVTVEPSDIELV